MCGILGACSIDSNLPSPLATAADLDRLVHRGPDSQGWHVDRNIVLGFRRLAIIDRAGGGQPLYNEDEQIVLTINGEVYNHGELRRRLENTHRFRSRVDGEVLLHAYERDGLGFLDDAVGMWAFALWDRRDRRLVLGRDRAGKKPLYWSFRDGVLRWASELRALVGDGLPPVDRHALHDYLRFGYIPSPRTPWQGINKLPPGHLLVLEPGGRLRLHRYWAATPRPDEGRTPDAAEAGRWAEELRGHLDEAVGTRLESEVPMGFLLSAGLDSASVFALGARRLAPVAVTAFTIGFAERDIDESPVAAEVADRYGARHVVRRVGEDEAASLEEVLGWVEEPISTDALLPTDRVFRSVRGEGIVTVLAGEGGDELFAGYRKFDRACHWLRDRSAGGGGLLSPLQHYLLDEEFVFAPGEIRALLGADLDDGRFAALEREAEGLDRLGQMLLFEQRLRLPDRINLRLDKLSMARSLEARAPFMDHRLIEFAGRIPRRLLHDDELGEKAILRRAMAPLLPDSVVRRPKAPFRAPDRWFAAGPAADALLSPQAVADAGLVDPDEVARLRSCSLADRGARERLYSLVVLHAWLGSARKALDGAPAIALG
ncbi:MAG: asparagine synthase (glutamine-hydrolyzing) [Planctomycetes bacterium]|nr:asparagine synthase (glutamine-hydrolyzing) [Planctomycetota bacterium]